MLSLWPAGLSSNGQGTIDWAGGLINWNSPYMQNGYYYAMVSDVTVECYDPPSGANVKGQTSYEYTSTAATNDTIEMIGSSVILKSLFASGDNPNYDPNGSGSTSPSATPESVPGVSGAGSRGEDTGDSSAAAASASSGSTQSTNTASSGFTQGTGSSGSSAGSKIQTERLGSSVIAILFAFGFMMCW